jgi:cytochrome c oxidase cbb3-type subunit 3
MRWLDMESIMRAGSKAVPLLAAALCVSQLLSQTAAGNGAAPARPGGRAQTSGQDPAAADRGEKLFASGCGFCHGSTARGGEGGPDLLRSVVVLDDVKGNLIRPVIRTGIQGTAMPAFANLTDAEVSDIVAWLHVQTFSVGNRGSYRIANIVTGDPKAGEVYFNGEGGCNKCHSPSGDLAGVGKRYDPQTLQSRFLMPRPRGGRGAVATAGKPVQATVILADGRSISGALTYIDDFDVSLRDVSGDLHTFARSGDTPKVELRDPYQAHEELLRKYTDADMHNLTAYLVTLK